MKGTLGLRGMLGYWLKMWRTFIAVGLLSSSFSRSSL